MTTLREKILRYVVEATEEDEWLPVPLSQIVERFECTRAHAYQIRRKLVDSGMLEQRQPLDLLTEQPTAMDLRATPKGRVVAKALCDLTPGQSSG